MTEPEAETTEGRFLEVGFGVGLGRERWVAGGERDIFGERG